MPTTDKLPDPIPKTETEIVEMCWQKVFKEIQSNVAVTAMVKETLDQAGATICFHAFDLVSKTLDGPNMIRKIHKSENETLNTALTNGEGPWYEKNVPMHTKYDYRGVWLTQARNGKLYQTLKNAHKEPEWINLSPQIVCDTFCEPVSESEVQHAQERGFADKEKKNFLGSAFTDVDVFLHQAHDWFKSREIQRIASSNEITKFDELVNLRLEHWCYEFDNHEPTSRHAQFERCNIWKFYMLENLPAPVNDLKKKIRDNCKKFGYGIDKDNAEYLDGFLNNSTPEALLEILSMSHKIAATISVNDIDAFGGMAELVHNVNDQLACSGERAELQLQRTRRVNKRRSVMIEFIEKNVAELYAKHKKLPTYNFFIHAEDIRRPTQQELTDLPICATYVTETSATVKDIVGTSRHTNAVFGAIHQSDKHSREDPDVSFGAYIVPKRTETDFLFLLSAPQNSEIVQNEAHEPDVKKQKRPIRRWQTKISCDSKDKTMNAAKILVYPRLYSKVDMIKEKTTPLEPYWLFDLRRKRNWTQENQDKYRYQYEDIVVLPLQKPDLMIEVSYNSKKVAGVKKRVVFVEVDGENKTTGQKSRKPNEKKSVKSRKKKKEHSDDEQDDTSDEDDDERYETDTMFGGSEALLDEKEVNRITQKDSGGNPAKLAMKMMQSVGVQMVLQPYTYNIRSNFYSFLKKKIEKSLFSTTNVQIPEYQELLSTLKARNNTVNNTQNDYEDLLRCIHLMHHIYIAHVKVAFYIYMFETYDIDLLAKLDNPFMYNQDVEKQESLSRMRDKHFFINFQAYNIPAELHFDNTMNTHVKEFLEKRMMLQSRIKTKYCNENDMVSTWQQAPVMDANSKRSNMHDWTANVHRQLFPLFPNEFESIVNVAYAAVERVNMKELCKIVLHAAKESFEAYYKSYESKLRLLDGLEFKRREFPDRCYLTRREQMDRTKWWNKNYSNDNRDNQFTTLQNKVQIYNTAHQQNPIKLPNKDDSRESGVALRNRAKEAVNDQIEIFLGYEEPVLKRKSYKSDRRRWTSKEYAMLKWDQVDVRMHFFNHAMQEKETFEKFQKYSRGVWYLQDYIDFFDMLRSIVFANSSNDSQNNADYYDFTTAPEIREQIVAGNLTLLDDIEKSSAWRLKLYLCDEDIKSVITPTTAAEFLAYNANWQTMSSVTINNDVTKMPSQTSQAAKAYHIFAIMSWFFDCRDGGACQFQWEDSILKYFGSEITEPDESIKSNFDIFNFEEPKKIMPDVAYFHNVWFQMTMFLEHNFRNAVAAVHYKLFQIDVIEDNIEYLAPHKIGSEYDIGLQAKIRKLVARRSSLLNNRAAFVGLKNVSRELSFKKFDPQQNTALTLRERILSQLDDDLPLLDPTLKNYVQQFKIPDSVLFLRIIRCPNILALRELAVQHISPHPHKYLQEVLSFFDPAVQSEIEVMLKFVHTDDSVYAATPQAHASSRVLLTRKCMLRWMHEIVDLQYMASGRLSCMYFCKTPLQCKFMMMMQANTVFMLERLLCKQELLNYASNRPIRFVLLQLRLLYNLLSCTMDENSLKKFDKETWRNDDFDDLLYYIEKKEEQENGKDNTWTVPRSINPVTTNFCISSTNDVNWTPGASRCEWPARDSNFVAFGPHKKAKNNAQNAANYLNLELEASVDASDDASDDANEFSNESIYIDNYEKLSKKFPFEINQHMLAGQPQSSKHYTYITAKNQNAEFCEMSTEEHAMWLMLAYIRPHAALQMHEDNARMMQSQSVLILQNTSLRRDQEDIVAHCDPQLDVNDAQQKCVIHADMSNEAHMFLELSNLQPNDKCKRDLPSVVQHLIPPIPNRKFIYIPPACATYLKKEHAEDVSNGFKFYDAFAGKYFWACRTFTGARCWTWKRFMIKTVFFDACSRVVSRNTEFLALYACFEQKSNPQYSQPFELTQTAKDDVIEAHKQTKNAFGNLEFKTNNIVSYFNKKNRMPTEQIFTLLIKTDREYRHYTDTLQTQTYDAHDLCKSKKISPNKYGYWLCNTMKDKILDATSDETNMLGKKPVADMLDIAQIATSCRYALILPRLLQSMKIEETMLQKYSTNVSSVAFVYRQYIYLQETPNTLFVKYHEKYYIAFPNNYAIFDEKIVHLKPKRHKRTIINFCNTRYRSCLPLKYIRNATDAADVSKILLIDYAQDNQLKCVLEESRHKHFMWDMKTFETNTSDLGFILHLKPDKAFNVQRDSYVLLPHTKSVMCAHTTDYKKMFMLPDFFCTLDKLKNATIERALHEQSKKIEQSAEDSSDELMQDLQAGQTEKDSITNEQKKILQAFMKLRTRNTYNDLLHNYRDKNIPLQNILTLIDQIIAPKSSEIF